MSRDQCRITPRSVSDGLVAIAENLARALGHSVKCQAQLGICICGAAKHQATALDDYEHWKREREVRVADSGDERIDPSRTPKTGAKP